MKRLVAAGLGVLMLVGAAFADVRIPAGSRIYVEEMPEGLDGFIRAELMKKKVPLTVVLTPDNADYIMTGSAAARKGSWHEGWLSANKDKASGSVVLVAKSNPDEVLWAEEAGDRSLMWGSLARGGPRKVASRLVDRLKKVVK